MSIDRIVSTAQIALSVIYVIGYFWLLYMFIGGRVNTPLEWKDQVSVLMGVLAQGVPMILQFWFARMRASSQPPTGQP